MAQGPTDVELREAIAKYHKTRELAARTEKEEKMWQRQNPPPTSSKVVESMEEIEKFNKRSTAYNKILKDHVNRVNAAKHEADEAEHRLRSLLPENYGYRYDGQIYSRGMNFGQVHVTEDDGR